MGRYGEAGQEWIKVALSAVLLYRLRMETVSGVDDSFCIRGHDGKEHPPLLMRCAPLVAAALTLLQTSTGVHGCIPYAGTTPPGTCVDATCSIGMLGRVQKSKFGNKFVLDPIYTRQTCPLDKHVRNHSTKTIVLPPGTAHLLRLRSCTLLPAPPTLSGPTSRALTRAFVA